MGTWPGPSGSPPGSGLVCPWSPFLISLAFLLSQSPSPLSPVPDAFSPRGRDAPNALLCWPCPSTPEPEQYPLQVPSQELLRGRTVQPRPSRSPLSLALPVSFSVYVIFPALVAYYPCDLAHSPFAFRHRACCAAVKPRSLQCIPRQRLRIQLLARPFSSRRLRLSSCPLPASIEVEHLSIAIIRHHSPARPPLEAFSLPFFP